MEGLTLNGKEQSRLQILNGVLERYWSMREAAPLLGVSERQGWRLLVAYRKPESTEGRPWGQSLKKPSGAPLNLG